MLKMVHLVQNENMKLYRKLGTWVMVALLVASLILVSILNTFIEDNRKEKEIRNSIKHEKRLLTQPGVPKDQKEKIKNEIQRSELALAQKISPIRLEAFLLSIKGVLRFISCFVVIVAASIIGKEFSDGTIKLLLIRPVSRSAILLSKYISTLLFAFFQFLIHFATTNLMVIFFLKSKFLSYVSGEIINEYATYSIQLLILLTLSFMISTIFRSTALAIGLTLFLSFTGSVMVNYLAPYFSGTKYILFSNMDLSQYPMEIDASAFPGFAGMSLAFSIKVLVVYYLAFLLITWFTFQKRDVSV